MCLTGDGECKKDLAKIKIAVFMANPYLNNGDNGYMTTA
jgi:hypothetical protein